MKLVFEMNLPKETVQECERLAKEAGFEGFRDFMQRQMFLNLGVLHEKAEHARREARRKKLQPTLSIKDRLSEWIDRKCISVRKRKSFGYARFNVEIKGDGVKQACRHRKEIENEGFSLFFYGQYDETGKECINPTGVRVSTGEL